MNRLRQVVADLRILFRKWYTLAFFQTMVKFLEQSLKAVQPVFEMVVPYSHGVKYNAVHSPFRKKCVTAF